MEFKYTNNKLKDMDKNFTNRLKKSSSSLEFNNRNNKFFNGEELYIGSRSTKNMEIFSNFKGKSRRKLTNAILLKVIKNNIKRISSRPVPHLASKLDVIDNLYSLPLRFNDKQKNYGITDITDDTTEKIGVQSNVGSDVNTVPYNDIQNSVKNTSEKHIVLPMYHFGKHCEESIRQEKGKNKSEMYIAMLYNTLYEIANGDPSKSEKEPMAQDINQMKIYLQNKANIKIKSIDTTELNRIMSFALIVSFAWKMSPDDKIYNLFPKNSHSKKMGGDPDEGTEMVNMDETGYYRRQPSPWRKRLTVFIALFMWIFYFMVLYENLKILYVEIQRLYDVYGSEHFNNDEVFTISTFLMTLQNMFFGSFQETLSLIQTEAIKHIQSTTLSVSREVKNTVENSWDLGIHEFVVGFTTGTSTQTASRISEIELDRAVFNAISDAKLSITNTRNLLFTRFSSALISINGLSTASLILLHSYNPRIVSREALGASLLALGNSYRGSMTIDRVWTTIGNTTVFGTGLLTFITNPEVHRRSVERITNVNSERLTEQPDPYELDNVNYDNYLMDAPVTEEEVESVVEENFNEQDAIDALMGLNSPEGYYQVALRKDSDMSGGRKTKKLRSKRRKTLKKRVKNNKTIKKNKRKSRKSKSKSKITIKK